MTTCPSQSVNFAFGGSQAGLAGLGEFGALLPGLLTQVAGFTNDLIVSDQIADPNALYILWSGANDYRSVDPPNPTEVVGNIQTAVNSLYNFGARNFLVLNLPDLGKIPQSLRLGSVLSTRLTDLTDQHNSLLDSTVNVLSQSLADINLISLDANNLFNQVLTNPGNFGFTNVTGTCLDEATFIACANPDEFVFWDSIHPSTASHQILAESTIALLKSLDKDESKSVPEPVSSASLGVIGLAWLFRKQLNKSC
ncbi:MULTISPECIES: SGNH/GDSL hydrolase family protein [Moorena]|uniref:SGNH/GDSL hydrolase family protein n=1 Tax=Moorena TaxID=1155738 RepID=UPI001E5F056D|nr:MULTISPECIES: SGNH/GDSL hydrolase family protein [Moorena]